MACGSKKMKYRGASKDYCINIGIRKLTLCFVNDSLLISPVEGWSFHKEIMVIR